MFDCLDFGKFFTDRILISWSFCSTISWLPSSYFFAGTFTTATFSFTFSTADLNYRYGTVARMANFIVSVSFFGSSGYFRQPIALQYAVFIEIAKNTSIAGIFCDLNKNCIEYCFQRIYAQIRLRWSFSSLEYEGKEDCVHVSSSAYYLVVRWICWLYIWSYMERFHCQ